MNQQIVVSKEIVDYFAEQLPAFKKTAAQDIIEFIEQNLFVSDNSTRHFNSILEKIEALEEGIKKEELKKLFNYWIQEKKVFVEYKFENNTDDELRLSDHTIDKIYFNTSLKSKSVKNFSLRYPNIEFHDVESFIKPTQSQRLKHLPTIITLEEGCYYDLNIIFEPFFRYTKNIRIEDPYLPNPKARNNLWKILSNFANKKIKLVFLKKDKYTSNDGIKSSEFDAFLNEINLMISEGWSIDCSESFKRKSHRERWIFTDEYQIYIPGGLDFLNNDGFYIKEQNDLKDIKYREQIRIEVRTFEVNF